MLRLSLLQGMSTRHNDVLPPALVDLKPFPEGFNEIRLSMSILCLTDICADGGSGASDLIGDDRFVLCFEILDQVYDFHCEVEGLISELRFLHNRCFSEVCPCRQVKYSEVCRVAASEVQCSAYRAKDTLHARSALHVR